MVIDASLTQQTAEETFKKQSDINQSIKKRRRPGYKYAYIEIFP